MDRREFLKLGAVTAAGAILSGRATEEEARSWRLTGRDVTEIVLVLDKSGSMDRVREATIKAINDFLAEQVAEPGKAAFTLTLFDTHYDTALNGVDIRKVRDIDRSTYRPGGWTALYDAVGRTIHEVQSRIEKIAEDRRPEKIICVILTDGEENSSTEYNLEQVRAQITDRAAHGWKFVFLGANQDAWETAKGMAIPVAGAATFAASGVGTQAAFAAASDQTIRLRRAADPGLWDPDLGDSSSGSSRSGQK